MDTFLINYLMRYYSQLLPIEKKIELKYPYLNPYERKLKEEELAKLILDKFRDKVFFNNCPKCEQLARTPSAKQCRFCGHDWH